MTLCGHQKNISVLLTVNFYEDWTCGSRAALAKKWPRSKTEWQATPYDSLCVLGKASSQQDWVACHTIQLAARLCGMPHHTTHSVYWERPARKRSRVLAAKPRPGWCYRDAVAEQVADQPSGVHSRWVHSIDPTMSNEQRSSRRG